MKDTTFSPEAYQNPDDRSLILEIMNHDAAVRLLDWAREQNLDAIYNGVYRSSFLRLSSRTAPQVIQVLEQACQDFGLETVPPVYLTWDYEDNITIGGITEPFLLVSQRYLRQLEAQPEMLAGIIAGQVAGIRVGHHRGLLLAWLLDTVLDLIAIPKPLVLALDALLNDWKRCRIYTCDAAMYLATRDLPLTLRGILSQVASQELLDAIQPGTPQDAYRQQIREFMEGTATDVAVNLLNSALSDTGWMPLRCHCVTEFAAKTEQEAGHDT